MPNNVLHVLSNEFICTNKEMYSLYDMLKWMLFIEIMEEDK